MVSRKLHFSWGWEKTKNVHHYCVVGHCRDTLGEGGGGSSLKKGKLSKTEEREQKKLLLTTYTTSAGSQFTCAIILALVEPHSSS